MIKVIENINDLELIKQDCNSLGDRFRMPLLRYEWIKNCADILSPDEKLNIHLLIEDDEIKAIVPLILKKDLMFERFEIVGYSLHKEPGGFLFKDEQSLYKLLTEIIDSGKSMVLKGIRAYSNEALCLNSILKQKNIKSLIHNSGIPFLPVSGTWKNFQTKISSSRRSSLRRLQRIAEKEGELKIEIISPQLNELDKMLDELFLVEASNWKKEVGTAMQFNSKLGIFFRKYLKDLAELGLLRLCFLRINNTAIAVQIGIEHENRFWVLKVGFDEKWAKCSPGVILMHEVIHYAFDNKLDGVEFLGSDEPWLHIWTDQFHDLVTYRIYQPAFNMFTDIMTEVSSSIVNKIHKKTVKSQSRSKRKYQNA